MPSEYYGGGRGCEACLLERLMGAAGWDWHSKSVETLTGLESLGGYQPTVV